MLQPRDTDDLSRFIPVFIQVCHVLKIPHEDLHPAYKMLIKSAFETWLRETCRETASQLSCLEFSKKAEQFADQKACEFLNGSAPLKNELWDQHKVLADDQVEKAAIDALLVRFHDWEIHDTSPPQDPNHARNVRHAKLAIHYILMFNTNPEFESAEMRHEQIYRLMRMATGIDSDQEVRAKVLRPILRKFSEWASEGCLFSKRAREIVCKRPGRQTRKKEGEIHE